MKRNVSSAGKLFGVAEAHILEANIAGDLATDSRLAPRPGSIWLIDDFENALARGAPGLHQLIELMQFADRFIQETGQHEKGDQIARAASRRAAPRAPPNPITRTTPNEPIKYIDGL